MISINIADDILAVFLIGVLTAIVFLKSSPFFYWIWKKLKELIAKYEVRREAKTVERYPDLDMKTHGLCPKCATKLDPYTAIEEPQTNGNWSVARRCPNQECDALWRYKSGMTEEEAIDYLAEKFKEEK